MTIREKILLKLAQNPDYEGVDETEKSLVKELKAEMAKANEAGESGAGNADPEVKAAAKELVGEMTSFMKTMMEAGAGENGEPSRKAVKGEPNAEVAKTREAFDEEVKAMIEEQGIKGDKEVKEFKKAYRFAEFAKALYNKDEARVKALAEGTPADGGYLVPDEFRADLIQHLLQTDAIRRYATVLPMEGKLLKIPKLTSDVKVYWGTENTSISTTTADFGELQLTPFRLNAIIYSSRELFDDSAISILEILRRRFVDRVRDEENRVFIVGTGSGQPKGIDAETFRTVNAGNGLSPDHITNAYWKQPSNYRRSSRWLINSRTIAFLENKKDNNGAYLYPSLQGEVPTLKGRPILVDDYVPSSKIFFGDLSYYYIGDRQQVTMEVTTEAGNTWEKHQVGLKLVERVDGEVALTQAFTEISNTGVN